MRYQYSFGEYSEYQTEAETHLFFLQHHRNVVVKFLIHLASIDLLRVVKESIQQTIHADGIALVTGIIFGPEHHL